MRALNADFQLEASLRHRRQKIHNALRQYIGLNFKVEGCICISLCQMLHHRQEIFFIQIIGTVNKLHQRYACSNKSVQVSQHKLQRTLAHRARYAGQAIRAIKRAATRAFVINYFMLCQHFFQIRIWERQQ